MVRNGVGEFLKESTLQAQLADCCQLGEWKCVCDSAENAKFQADWVVLDKKNLCFSIFQNQNSEKRIMNFPQF